MVQLKIIVRQVATYHNTTEVNKDVVIIMIIIMIIGTHKFTAHVWPVSPFERSGLKW